MTMKSLKTISAPGIAGLICATGFTLMSVQAMAAPIAPHPPFSKLAKRMMAVHPEAGGPPPCPDAAVVPVPAYPGSYCVEFTPSNDARMPAYVELLSTAPVKTVRLWYAKHLKGWQDKYGAGRFTPVGWSRNKGPFEPVVTVETARNAQILRDHEKEYDFAGVKTHIRISYVSHKGAGS